MIVLYLVYGETRCYTADGVELTETNCYGIYSTEEIANKVVKKLTERKQYKESLRFNGYVDVSFHTRSLELDKETYELEQFMNH